MGWYDSAWKQRIAISLHKTGATTADEDIVVDFPTDLDYFWTNVVETNGDDIIITEPDGITPISLAQGNAAGWDLKSSGAVAFNKTARVGGVRVEAWTGCPGQGATDSTQFIWVYFNRSSGAGYTDGSTATIGALSFTSADFEQAHQRRSGHRIVTSAEPPGATAPANQLSMTTGDVMYVYWDFSRELVRRQYKSYGHLNYEELEYVEVDDYTGGAGPSSTVTTQTGTQISTHGNVVRTSHTGGASGTDYTVVLKAHTSHGRTLDRRFLLKVYDPDDQ